MKEPFISFRMRECNFFWCCNNWNLAIQEGMQMNQGGSSWWSLRMSVNATRLDADGDYMRWNKKDKKKTE